MDRGAAVSRSGGHWGKGFPMWNGIWKLTAMVGVVGVGLFAAYQAQLGMKSLTVAIKPGDTPFDEASPEQAAPPEEAGYAKGTLPDDEPSFAQDQNSEPEPQVSSSSRRRKSPSEPDNGSFDELSPKQSMAKKGRASNNTDVKIQAVNRRAGVDFRKLDEPEETATDDANQTTTQLIEDDAEESKSRREPIQQTNVSSTDDAATTSETEANPFPDDVQVTVREEELSTDTVAQDKPPQQSGKAQVSADFDSDPPPIVSKRAKQKAGKKAEVTVEEESNPFGDDPLTPPPASKSLPTEDAPAAIPSNKADPLTESAPVSIRDSVPAKVPESLPQDPAPIATQPSRTRNIAPAQLPEDLNSDPLADSAPRKREPSTRRLDYDRVMPVDMIGDGVIGDASQRGLQQPRLTIEKVAQQQAVLEQPLIYTIIVKNAGTVDAHNVVIEDRIPKGSELVGTSPQAELSGKRLIWNHLILKPNEEKKISIKVIPKQEGPIGSVARVYFATEVSAEIVVAAPQLEFTVKAPQEVRLGQRFDMIFNLKNVGKVDANNIIVRDIVPDELKNDAGSDIECPVGKLAPDEVREIVLSVTASKTGSVMNRATLTADSGVKKTLDSTIDIVGEVLVLTRSGQNRLYVERPVVFTNNIRNDGNQRADRVRIAEVVPAGMEFETASDGGKYDPNLRAVVWTLGPLAPGNDKSVTVKYVPKETGTHAAKITATGAAGSTAAVNSSVDVVGKPELQMETLSATGAVTLGERITSRFQLNNTGTAAAMNVQLRIRLPRELRLISVKGAKFQQQEDDIIFDPIIELAPRTKAAYELVLEPIAEADAQIALEISADHLTKPGRRIETIQIARDALK